MKRLPCIFSVLSLMAVMVIACLAFVPMAFAADPAPVVIQPAPTDPIQALIAALAAYFPVIGVLGAVYYFFFKPAAPANPALPAAPAAPMLTGRPVLDLILQAALNTALAKNPLVAAAITAEAQAIKIMLDKYGVPEVPLPPAK